MVYNAGTKKKSKGGLLAHSRGFKYEDFETELYSS